MECRMTILSSLTRISLTNPRWSAQSGSYLLRSGSALAPPKQSRARRSRQETDPPRSPILPLCRRREYLRSQPPRRRTGDGVGEPVSDQEAAAKGQRGEKRGGATGGA